MISAKPWELAAALAVLEQAQMEAATLRDAHNDEPALRIAEHRCGSARHLVERIRATLNLDLDRSCTQRTLPMLRQGELRG